MIEKLPAKLDVALAARKGAVLSYVLKAGDMVRLAQATEGVEGDAEVTLRFSLFDQRWPMVDISVGVPVRLTCQRSMQSFVLPLQAKARVAFVPDEDVPELPEDIEPLAPEDAQNDPREWIEDSLLLALPLVPVQPGSSPVACVVGEALIVEEEPVNPFAQLKEMMKKE